MPTDRELDQYYRNQYRLDYQFALFRPSGRHVARKEAEAARRFAALAPHLPEGGARFLDFGCGSGELVRRMGREGHEAVGLEPCETYSAHGSAALRSEMVGPHARIDHGAWQHVDYADGSFDAISALHVIEHLRDPIGALKVMHRWLAPDGVLYLDVPNLQGYELKGIENFHFAHVLGFSRDNLIHAAWRAGFAPLASESATSILFRKRRPDDPEGAPGIDLAGTAARNRAEHGRGTSIGAYLAYHLRRVRYRLLRAG